jgi:coenzyme PQQ precursor peptide PqqA
MSISEVVMAWKKPRVTEISVGMEINCYACAELKA